MTTPKSKGKISPKRKITGSTKQKGEKWLRNASSRIEKRKRLEMPKASAHFGKSHEHSLYNVGK